MNIDIKKGDILLGGRFQNKRIVAKTLSTDEIGQPTVNDHPLLRYRIEKKLPADKQSSKTRELNMDKVAMLSKIADAIDEQQPVDQSQAPQAGAPQAEQPQDSGPIDIGMIIDFLVSNPNPQDSAVHALAEQNGIAPDQMEAAIYTLATKMAQTIRGGKSNESGFDISTIDPAQLEMGMQVESEHTPCPILQKKIAIDHLTEDPQYYTHLKEMEDKYKAPEGGFAATPKKEDVPKDSSSEKPVEDAGKKEEIGKKQVSKDQPKDNPFKK